MSRPVPRLSDKQVNDWADSPLVDMALHRCANSLRDCRADQKRLLDALQDMVKLGDQCLHIMDDPMLDRWDRARALLAEFEGRTE